MQSRGFERWRPRLEALCDQIRAAIHESSVRPGVTPPVRSGAGDVSFAPDVRAEEAVAAWLHATAAREPLSLLTEDAGWSHAGPDGAGGVRALPGFDHGGPRLALDPIDGTRNWMADLRPAWTALAFANPGADAPRLADVCAGMLSELPASSARSYRRVRGDLGASLATLELRSLASDDVLEARALRADDDDRVDHGYFPFFRYLPAQRPALAAVEAEFFARLEREEGADVRSCYDDQYISNAGQLVLLSLGTYRFVADLRAWLAARDASPAITSKPYDVAGAIACARAAGCEVVAADGAPLDFPLDAETPVTFVGYANRLTRERLLPHLRAALGAT